MIRLNESKESMKNEDGFASAESIALAVLGVVIVAGVYAAISGPINAMVGRMVTRITAWG